MIGGFLEPSSGKILLDGIDITKLTDDQILYLAKRIREVEAKQTNSAASELRAAFDSMI